MKIISFYLKITLFILLLKYSFQNKIKVFKENHNSYQDFEKSKIIHQTNVETPTKELFSPTIVKSLPNQSVNKNAYFVSPENHELVIKTDLFKKKQIEVIIK